MSQFVAKGVPTVLPSNALMYRPGAVRGGRGWLMIDNRASGGTLEEYATLTCAHCNCIVVLHKERKRPRGYCRKCHAYICDDRRCIEHCAPIQKCVELAQKYPGLPTLPRAKDGGLLFDPALLEEGRLF